MKRHFVHVAVLCAFCVAIVATGAPVFGQDPSAEGQWDPVLDDWPLVAIHMVLLKNGKVLCFGGIEDIPAPTPWILFDPGDGTVTGPFETPAHPNGDAKHNLFCSGHSALPDGTIVFNGGALSSVTKPRSMTPRTVQTGRLASWTRTPPRTGSIPR